ncbi:MAG TPA: GAF domain-containing protein [Baekduia sp.]|uniref:GAF domain-containing protein n=1 Tax=Baekduia sp. TaxID=2600305 RepID=UPI002BF0218F|nr:GAF domain-containing protein [Baekduia sp.]HMJ35051.1 GAF domain-containing protein [Baekduia sp.]
MRPRHIARIALFLALTAAGFIIARALAERDAQRESERRAEVAAVQIRGRLTHAASLTESLRRFMLDRSGSGVTSDQFTRNALRWLSPAHFSAAAWVEQVPDARRAAYERRLGQAIVTPDERHRVVHGGSRSSYLPATLVSGFPPMAVPGIDLSGVPGMSAALARATRIDGVAATPMASPSAGMSGLFLVVPAPNLIGEVLRPGYVALFVSDLGLRAAATGAPMVQVRAAGAATGARGAAETSSMSFTAAGQRFDVVVPREPVEGPAAVLPWIILAGGLVVAALGGALGLYAARRATAQEELDRIFTLSQDLIAVADFSGRFTRVNPAAEKILGYTEEELLARPYVELVHPADRDSTVAEADAIAQGKMTASFENRYLHKDGSVKVLDWTTTPDVENRHMYAVARDVTERRKTEAEAKRLADEQAALRRVATLVARDASRAEIFAVIAEECARLFGTEDIGMVRYEGDRDQVVMASSGAFKAIFPSGSRQPLGGDNATSRVLRTGRPARIDDYGRASGPIAEAIRPIGLRCAVATPIMVEGRLWGAMVAGTTGEEPLPPETESRLGQFTELMATAIANAESRAQAGRLTEEQAALRRVATLVAKEAPPAEVFAKVAGELANVLGDVDCSLFCDEGDGIASVVALAGAGVSAGLRVGTRLPVDGGGVIASVLREGRACRIDDYSALAGDGAGAIAQRGRELGIRSAVACPVVVGDRIWGAMGAARYEAEAFPPETETRIAQFADLVATAIANADARAEVERLAEEQAALRRVAVLVARGAPPEDVFAAVVAEAGRVFPTGHVGMGRYESDGAFTVLGSSSVAGVPVGSRWPIGDKNLATLVFETARPARIDDFAGATGGHIDRAREAGVRSSVGMPIIVEGRLWGVFTVATSRAEPLPADTDEHFAAFTDLVATAIANAEAQTEVAASRARIVAATDEERRRVVRDLHDGAQQRLVHTVVTLKLTQQAVHNGEQDVPALVGEALDNAQQAMAELRELAHGILPVALTQGGLRAGVDALASRMPVPIEIDVTVGRLPAAIEATAYFVVAEALTNVAKHADARHAEVSARIEHGTLVVHVRDDGVGGARPDGGGLIGLVDRLAAVDGELRVDSPADSGTLVAAAIPLPG